MKVILIKDVAKIGRRGEQVEVPDGYALNQLIPKKMAEPATVINLKRFAQRQATVVATKEADRAEYAAAKASLLAHVPVIKVEANDKGHLFKAVSAEDISEAARVVGIVLPVAMIKIARPIKEVGKHEVELVGKEETSTFTIEVITK
jgi:large subunit ribosomal protein L9